jgi:hypothetical protein
MIKKTTVRFVVSLFAFAFFSSLASESLYAIPAFARKYRMSCKTCHVAVPKLKPYGDEFAGNGFELPDQEAPRFYVDTGDDRLSLIRDFPIAVRMDGFLNYNDYDGKKADFTSPYIIKILSGGAISKNIAYYFYFLMDERGEIAGVEDAFVMFNNLLGADFDIYLGQFQISDPLFKRELRLTFEDYKIYDTDVGHSMKNLSYDRGLMMTYGLPSGTDFVFQLLNGNGIGEADAARNFDNDKYKDVLGRISQDFSENLRLGFFGWSGRERSTGILNKVWMIGPDATITAGDKFELNLQYVERRDDNPLFLPAAANEIKTKGAFAEMIISPKGDESKVFLVGLFNWVDSDLDELDYKSLTGHLSYILRRNVRLVGEVTHNWANDTNRVGVGFVSAF